MRAPPSARGFSLIEMMIASSIALVVIAGAVSAGIYLQRRGLLEERTMETQNAGRAARDLLVPAVQRAGAGFGSAPLYLGGASTELRYAVSVATGADFSGDSTFAPPSGAYAGLRSDALEVFEADVGRSLRLVNCPLSGDVRQGGTSPLCLEVAAPADTDGGLPASTPLVVADPADRSACVGVALSARNTGGNNLAWSLGAPGASAFGAISPCTLASGSTVPPLWREEGEADDPTVMPLSARAFRVNWKSGQPVLEMDPDGALGGAGYQPLSAEIERIQVRLGVTDPASPDGGVAYYPDPSATPARPAVDTCTNAACWAGIPGDAGTMGANDYGPGSARDELMRRVRVVELLITARSQRPDTQSIQQASDGGVALDDEGNPLDGYKRRHFLIRVTPRNFGFAGG